MFTQSIRGAAPEGEVAERELHTVTEGREVGHGLRLGRDRRGGPRALSWRRSALWVGWVPVCMAGRVGTSCPS